MLVGAEGNKSKTEVVFFPGRTPQKNHEDTKNILYADGTYITFAEKFTFLGSIITSSLQDDENVNNQISKDSCLWSPAPYFLLTRTSLSPLIATYTFPS